MAKKVMKKKALVKKVIKKKKTSSTKKSNEKILIENFASLQRVMTNLSLDFKELSEKISNLLELFESSANALAKKDINFTKPIDEEGINKKLDSVLDQNRIIARGLSLMHEKIESPAQNPIQTAQAPRKPAASPTIPRPSGNNGEYQKSAYSKGV